MSDSKIIATHSFEGLDELIDALNALRDLDADNFLGVEGAFAIQGFCVLWDHGEDIHVVEITDKRTAEFEAEDIA